MFREVRLRREDPQIAGKPERTEQRNGGTILLSVSIAIYYFGLLYLEVVEKILPNKLPHPHPPTGQ